MTENRDAPSGGRKRSILPLVIGLPLIAVIAAVAIYFTSTSGNETSRSERPEPAPEQAASESGQEDGVQDDSGGDLPTPTLGDPDAPVVMQEFSDYQ